jgi:hypothetical protein
MDAENGIWLLSGAKLHNDVAHVQRGSVSSDAPTRVCIGQCVGSKRSKSASWKHKNLAYCKTLANTHKAGLRCFWVDRHPICWQRSAQRRTLVLQ